jgi:hypothetical protein
MGKRHEAIGIKQAIRFDWMQKTANLLLAGLDAKTIRQELHEFLTCRNGNDCTGERSEWTRTFAVNNLMNIWVSPDRTLIPFRNASLALLQTHPKMSMAIHWGMISAAYPFWFSVARQTGRLLALQEQVTQLQIINRLKEQYGDRQTVSRHGRFVIRSFVAWGVLKDARVIGCYDKSDMMNVDDYDLVILMFEAALHAMPEGQGTMHLLTNHPAFFPFQLPVMTGDVVSRRCQRVDVARYGLDDELLKLNNHAIEHQLTQGVTLLATAGRSVC